GLAAPRGERTEAVFALGPSGRDALAGSVRVGARQLATLRALAAGAVTSRDLTDAGGSATAARALAKRGLVIVSARAVRRVPAEFAFPDEDRARDLPATGPQAVAIGAITAALGSGRGFLLHGVTASGKTEVYVRAATAALARGDGVIVLVPEIILTAQVVARFIARFGDRVAHAAGACRRAPAAAHHRRGPAARASVGQPRHALAGASPGAPAHRRGGRAGDPLFESARLRHGGSVPRLRLRREVPGLRDPVRVSRRRRTHVPPLRPPRAERAPALPGV